MLSKPSVAKYKFTLDSDIEVNRLLATSAHEVVGILITAGGTAAAGRVYDTKSADSLDTRESILIAANAGESSSFAPAQPIPYLKGIYVVMEQGTPGGAELVILYN